MSESILRFRRTWPLSSAVTTRPRDPRRSIAARNLSSRVPTASGGTGHDIPSEADSGLGFTRDGKRLGRGGGYYDATLKAASARSRRVGLAFRDQVVDTMPTTSDDVDMDQVVTESQTLRGLYRDWDFLDT